MKTSVSILCIIAAAGAMLTISGCKEKGKNASVTASDGETAGIVYVDIDRILKEYDMANEMNSVMQGKYESIQQELNRKGGKIERDAKSFQDKINKGLLTQSVAEIQYKKIQEDQARFQEYAAQRQQEIQEQMVVTQNQILNAISTYIKTYNEDKGYAMILATQGDNISVPVVTAAENMDITDDIIEGLNKEYVKDKNKNSEQAPADSTKKK